MTARIHSIETFVVRYPVIDEFRFLTADANRSATRDTLLVKISDENGNHGWGQCVPSPSWSYETLDSVSSTITKYLAPSLLGMNPFDIDAVWQVMNRIIAGSFSVGQPICKAGIDIAIFDLTSQILQQSAQQRWNRFARQSITLSWTVDVRDIEQVSLSVSRAHSRGFANFNVKVGRSANLDVEVCREIRRLAPSAFVWVDANGGYDLETALLVAPKFADLGVAALEQPLAANQLTGYQQLHRQGALPILMDEGVVSVTDLTEFHRLGLLDGVAMKVSRSGGLTIAQRMIEFLSDRGLLFFASGLTDPDVSLAASLQLFAAYDLQFPAALNASQFLNRSILKTPLRQQGDQLVVPSGFGLGVDVDEWRLSDALPE